MSRRFALPSWDRLSLASLAAIGMLASSGCIGGPCIHTYEEDVLILDEVRDALTDAPLREVIITEVRQAGTALSSVGGDGITALGAGTYRCQLPCSFGTTSEGRYEIDLSADGYEATTLVADARYAAFQGGCPSSNDGGTRLTGALTPLSE